MATNILHGSYFSDSSNFHLKFLLDLFVKQNVLLKFVEMKQHRIQPQIVNTGRSDLDKALAGKTALACIKLN